MDGFKSEQITYIRNFIFGVEDSLVSTVGLLSGIAAADVSTRTIALTGVVLIFVEAFSMGVGSYLSEHSVESFQAQGSAKQSEKSGVVMLVSYLIAGFIPLFPYLVMGRQTAFWLSIVFSLIALFALGAVSAKILKTKMFLSGLRMFLLGGLAIGIGVLVGKLLGQ